jgi:hypothetical protein
VDNKNHKFRPTIAKVFRLGRDNKGNVISVEDALNQGKIKFTASGFGKNVSPDYVYCNVDFDEALMLAHMILGGTFAQAFPPKNGPQQIGNDTIVAEYTAYKGSPKSDQFNGQPESRMIEIRGMLTKNRDGKMEPRYSITMWVGPGQKTATGAIMPSAQRSQMISQRVYLSVADITKMFLKIKLHVESYYHKCFDEMYDPATGTIYKGFRNDLFSDPNAPRHAASAPQVPAEDDEWYGPDAYDLDETPAPEPEEEPESGRYDIKI